MGARGPLWLPGGARTERCDAGSLPHPDCRAQQEALGGSHACPLLVREVNHRIQAAARRNGDSPNPKKPEETLRIVGLAPLS